MIFKTILDNVTGIPAIGKAINEINSLKLDVANISGYATAIKGLSVKQAELVLSTKGLSVAQQQAVLSEAGLLATTGKLTTAELEAILITKKRNKDQAEALLIKAGLITSETAEATATNVVTASKLKELVQTKALTKAEADLIAAKAGVSLANQKESVSILATAGAKLKGIGTALKGVGTGILTIAQAHPVIAGITVAIALLGGTAIANKVKQEKAAKAIKEAYEEAKTTIDEINNSYNETSIKTKEISKEYAELAQGVDLLTNSNKNLSTERYERFLDLSNQLSSLFPQLTRGYDDNGSAILDLSGDVNTIVDSLDDLIDRQRQLANQEIVKQMPDLFAGYSNNVADYKEDLEEAENTKDKIQKAYDEINKYGIYSAFNINGYATDENGDLVGLTLGDYMELLETLGITTKQVNLEDDLNRVIGYKIELEDGSDIPNLSVIHDTYVSTFNTAVDDVKYAKQQLEAETSSINQYLNTWLQTEFSYNQVEDVGLQKAIQEMLFNFDWSTLPEDIDKNDWGAVSEYLRRNILFAINDVQDDPEISKAISEVFTNQDLTPDEKANYLQQIKDYFDNLLGEDNAISISLQPQIDDTDALQKSYEDTINRFKNNVTEAQTQQLEDAKQNLEDEYKKISDWGLDDYADQIKNGTLPSQFGNVDMDNRQIIDWNIDNIEKWKDALSDIKYYDKDGNFIESYYDQLEESAKNGESCIDTVFGDLMDEIEGYGDITALSFSHVVNNDDGTFEFLGQKTAEEYLYGILDVAKKDGDMSIDHILELDKKGFENAEVYDAQGKVIGETYIHGIISGFNDNAKDISELTHFAGKFGAPQIAKREISDLEKKYGEDGSQKIKDFLDAKGISGNSSLLDEFNEVTQGIVIADIAIQRWNEHVKEVDEPTSFSDAWKALESTTDDKIKGLSNDLLELANKGQLTAETFKKADSTDYFKNLGISADEAVNKINALAQSSSQLSSMSSQVSAMSNALKTKSENGYVSADTLAGFNDDVKGMDSWKEFERLMGDSTSSVQECKEAAGQLATEWINSNNFLTDLNESTKEYYITQLDAMGVENAREVIANRLLQKQKMLNAENEFAKKTGKELADATDEEIVNFIREADCTDVVKEGISEFILEKKLAGETKIDLIPDLEVLANYVEALGYAADAIRAFDNAKKNVTKGSGSFAGAPAEAYKYLEDNAQGELDDVFAKIKAKINGTIEISANGSKNSSSSSSSSNSDFDWIQVKLEAISKITDKLQKKFEKTFTVNSAAKKFKDYLSQINSEISANKTAGQTYLNYFNSVGLSSEWKNKIKSGKYKIDKNVDSATADKISEAQGYWNNYLQTLETIDQLEDERESAEDTYANKVIDHYNKQIEKQQKLLDLKEKFVSIRATWSDFANTASDYRYEQSKNMEQIKTYDNAIAKYRSLQKTVTEGSDAWNTYNDQIKDNQDKISELTLSNAELSKSIMNLPLDNASKKIEKYSNNLSLLQTKYSSLNMADSKNKNIDLQQKQSANIKAANDAALREANANLNSAWAAIRTKDLKTINKNAKKGNYLIQASDTREGYKAIIDYNNALTAQKKAYEEAEKASAEYYRTVQENTKTKWDNIINQYQTNYDYFNSKSSRASAYLDYRKSMGYSNTSIYQEDAYKDQLQAQKDALAELETERSKLDWNKIQKQYEAGELQRDDYFALAKTIKELDSSIYKVKSDINETNATINKIPFQRLEYQIGTLTNKQTELSNALSLKQKLNEAIKAEDYTSQINTNKQLEKLYISENTWLQEQLETVSVNSDKWKEWTDAIASNESKINSLKQSNEDLKDSLRSEVYIKPFEKMATKIDFLKERLSSFLGLVNDTDTMFDDKGAFTKNGEAALGLSLKNIDAAKSKIENIQNKIQEAQKLYNNGNNDIGYSEEEYANDMRQYISDMWNAVSESKSASDEIVNIYQEQGQAILDALNKEINARSEALQKKKEYYDYDKTIKTKTKDIQSLETQIAAMQSMEDSLEKRKKLLALQEELNEKQEDLKNTQLDHQINIVVDGLDDFSTQIQENFDDSVKELKTNLDKQAEIINEANRLYADSYNSIFEHLSKLMKYYGIDASKLPSDLKDTTIGNLKGFSRGGVARDLSGVIKQNGDSLLASINPNETVLTERFTELMPHAVNIMEGLIKTPVIPPSSVMQPNVNIQFNVDGNVDSVTWDTIKKEIPNISKQVQKDIYVDLKKSGALRK